MTDRYLVIFDTVALVQSTINPKGPAGKCLDCFLDGRISVAISRETLKEVKDVLSRAALRNRFPQITDEKVSGLTDSLQNDGIYLRRVPRHFTYPRDPKDEPYLNLAVEVHADYLISRDNDMLDLMKWNQEAGREFQKRFRFLKIVSPEDFLAAMEKDAA